MLHGHAHLPRRFRCDPPATGFRASTYDPFARFEEEANFDLMIDDSTFERVQIGRCAEHPCPRANLGEVVFEPLREKPGVVSVCQAKNRVAPAEPVADSRPRRRAARGNRTELLLMRTQRLPKHGMIVGTRRLHRDFARTSAGARHRAGNEPQFAKRSRVADDQCAPRQTDRRKLDIVSPRYSQPVPVHAQDRQGPNSIDRPDADPHPCGEIVESRRGCAVLGGHGGSLNGIPRL